MYSRARQRDYEWLKTSLLSNKLVLERNEFVAVLNVITNCDEFGFPKQRAIKMASEQNGVTQLRIKQILNKINYKTQNQYEKEYSTKGFNESRHLLEKMSLDELSKVKDNKKDEIVPFESLYKKESNKKLKGIYFDEDVAKVLNELGDKGGKGSMSAIVNETLRNVFVEKGLLK